MKLHCPVKLVEEVGERWNDGTGGEGELADEAAKSGSDGEGLHVSDA